MKKIIGIFSIVLVLCLMAVPVMAESINGGVDFTYEDNGDGTYDVKLVVTADSAKVAYAMGSITFDPTVWSTANYAGVAYDLSQISNGKIAFNETSGNDVAYAKDSVVFGFTATCLNEGAIATAPFTVSGDAMICDSTTNDILYAGMDTTWALTIEPAASEPTVVTGIAATSAEYKVVQGAENSYWGVWVGTYTVNAGGKALVKAKVDFAAADKSFETDALNVEGSGDVVFDIAIIGVPTEYQNAGIATATLQ